MKLLPIPLSPLGAPPPMGMWSSDLLWRYPPAPPSPLAELRTQLPQQLLTDPRIWGREEVAVFLRWSEREFDLPKFELDLFQMNGKAICLLSKTDFAERCPAAGDVLHNVLHMLVRDAQMQHRHLPSSPVTPTSRYPLSPHSQPPTPNWSALAPPENPFYTQHLQQFMQSNSVTLSPAPSTDSQVGSPPQHPSEQVQSSNFLQSSGSSGVSSSGSNGAASNNSDSDEEPQYPESSTNKQSKQAPLVTVQQSTATTARNANHHSTTKHLPPPLVLEPKALANWSISGNDLGTPTPSPLTPSGGLSGVKREFFPNQNTPNTPLSAGAFIPVKREFFPDTPEPNTNGRLLWDFLQQLLNDVQQRYSNYIAWKCRDTGVFKIVDPAGLAKLWGIQKNHLSMNYDKMSRALRYYYRVNILRKVQGERHCYQFLRNPSELKSIKNISLLRQTMANQQAQQQQQQQQQQQHSINQSIKKEHQAPPQSPSYLMNGSIASIMTNNVTNFAHMSAASSQQRQTSPVPPSPHHRSQPSPVIKMENHDIETDDMKPTDLSTNSSSSRNGSSESVDCYPLIRNSNGLTTIQILRHHQESNNSNYPQRSASVSPQPYIKPSLSPVQQHHQSHESLMDDMPTDLSKTDASSYYK